MGNPPRAEIEESMQYHHPEKTLAALPGGQEIGEELLAPFFGTDVKTYREIKSAFAERARRCARELLHDARFARLVNRLPFEPGSNGSRSTSRANHTFRRSSRAHRRARSAKAPLISR